MDKPFWLDKWQANEIGFHLHEFHPLLQKYSKQLYSNAISVFVPLCGKTKDMVFLQSEGLSVLGCELSEVAAQDFFAEQNNLTKITVKTIEKELFTSYQQNHIEILVGDFFDLTASQLNSFECIYDRAALIALPKNMRINYVAHLRNIIPKAKMLLITLDYDQSIISGPPFSVDKNEVESLFSFAKVEQLYRKNIIEQEPRFKSKGLESFYQTVYKIKW